MPKRGRLERQTAQTGGSVRRSHDTTLHTDFVWVLGSRLLNTQHRVRKECLRSGDDNGMAKDLGETGLGLWQLLWGWEEKPHPLILTGLDFSFRDRVLLYSPGWLQLAGGPLAVSGSPSCLILPRAGLQVCASIPDWFSGFKGKRKSVKILEKSYANLWHGDCGYSCWFKVVGLKPFHVLMIPLFLGLQILHGIKYHVL